MLITLYAAAIIAANFSVAWFGPAISPLNAFLLIGLDFAVRDTLHERYGFTLTLGITLSAALASWLLNPAVGMIAVASAVSFLVANIADGTVYQLLMKRPKLIKANGSNTAGALVDSLLFPTIAFGAIMPEIMALQFIAKVAGGAIWSLVLIKAKFA